MLIALRLFQRNFSFALDLFQILDTYIKAEATLGQGIINLYLLRSRSLQIPYYKLRLTEISLPWPWPPSLCCQPSPAQPSSTLQSKNGSHALSICPALSPGSELSLGQTQDWVCAGRDGAWSRPYVEKSCCSMLGTGSDAPVSWQFQATPAPVPGSDSSCWENSVPWL